MAKTVTRMGLKLAKPMRARMQSAKGLLMVSGGADSTALFHFLLSQKKQMGPGFAVMHVNYGLRGADSLADERFVRALCRKYKIACYVKRLKLNKGSGIQQKARLIRRRFAGELAQKHGFGWLATAHHLDDQIETLVMRAARGAGLSGLVGIRAMVPLPSSSLMILRPFLHWPKAAILKWLKQNNFAYRDDASNQKPAYTRNRIRIALKQLRLSPKSKEQIVKPAAALSYFDDYFNGRLSSALSSNGPMIARTLWDAWPSELQFRYFARQMKRQGYCGQVQSNHYQAFLSGKVQLGPALAACDAQQIVFGGGQGAVPLRLKKSGAYHVSAWGLTFSIKSISGGRARLEIAQGNKGVFYLADQGNGLILDKGSMPESLVPFGRKRARPLGEWLKASGVPLLRRQFAPVLRTLSGQIVFIFDTGLSNNARILPRTRRALALQIL